MKNKNIRNLLMVGTAVMVFSMAITGCNIVLSDPTTATSEESEETTDISEETSKKTEKVTENHPNADGIWKRTDTHSGITGTIEITNSDNDGFDFDGEFYHFGNGGELSGRAEFVAEDVAEYVSEYNSEIKVYFTFTEEWLTVVSDGMGADLGLGNNVTVSGKYSTKEPAYTNANIVEDTFTDDELSVMKSLLTDDQYDNEFINDTECGQVWTDKVVLSDGTKGKCVSCFMPGLAAFMGYELVITEDGMFYYQYNGGTFATNDSKCSEMPEYTVQ